MLDNLKPRQKFFVFTVIFILSFPLLQDNVFSWGKQVHIKMTDQAIELMPNDFFIRYGRNLWIGAVEPDENRVISHINVPDCIYMIKVLAKKCEEMVRSGEDWSKIMFTLGQATHYIQDLNNPQHSIGYYIKGEHEKFEEIAVIGFWRKENFDGFYYIKNYKIFATNTSNWSKRYLDFTYKLRSPYDEPGRKLMTRLWDHSIHCTAHLWLTVMLNGLGEEKFKKFGFPNPIGTRDDQKIRFHKIKELK